VEFAFTPRRFLAPFFLSCLLLFVAGCSSKIQGWSREAFRGPAFSMEQINHEGLALLPIIILEQPSEKNSEAVSSQPTAPYAPAGSAADLAEQDSFHTLDAYRVIYGEILLSEIQARRPNLKVISSADTLKQLNDHGLADAYRKFNRNFSRVGLDNQLLKNFGKALNCRYLFIGLAVVTESRPEASITVIWTFGRKSVLRSIIISGQIWDAVSGRQVWEGSGVGYNRSVVYEGSPLNEEIASEAVERLLENIMPKR